MHIKSIKIIAAVVDTTNLTLYRENGETIIIPQGDTRIRGILDQAVPQITASGYAYVTIEAPDNSYAQFEKESNGVVKLFRVAKSKLLGLFAAKVEDEPKPVDPMFIGAIPIHHSLISALDEIMAHAVPVASPEFTELGLHVQGNVVENGGDTIKEHSADTELDTIVAVIDGKVIPGMEKIKTQFGRAAKLGSTKGVENFLKRLGSVIEQRSHSVEDILKFMERGDLPIADDGSILIYKVLERTATTLAYVDCHTRKVEQWVGAYVCMDPSLVDHNRNNECSNGLHVARRGYIKEFSGDVCVLAKLAPEDVIAVPTYDANKMRVCGYHIIAELSQEEFSLVKKNKPISEIGSGWITLGNAVGGKHIGKTHEVRITEQRGGGVVVTPLVHGETYSQPKEAVKAEALANPSQETQAPPVDPKGVVEQVAQQLSRKEQAQKLYQTWCEAVGTEDVVGAMRALMDFKKASKVSWEKLGIDPGEALVKTMADVPPKLFSADADATDAFVEVELEAYADEQRAKTTATPKIDFEPKAEGSPRERIQKLLGIGLNPSVAQAVLKLKKQSKKSWSALGVSDTQAKQIMALTKEAT